MRHAIVALSDRGVGIARKLRDRLPETDIFLLSKLAEESPEHRIARDPDGGVDERDMAFGKLDVDGRSGDLNDASHHVGSCSSHNFTPERRRRSLFQ